MKRKNFMLSVAAAAVLGAFNPAFAQNTVNVDPNLNADANVGISNGDQSVSSSTNASQSSTDINSSSTMDQSASTTQSPSAPDAGLSANSGATSSTQSSTDTSSSASADEDRGRARGHDEDKLTGLDRADQVAGEHGAQGRANAREKQERGG